MYLVWNRESRATVGSRQEPYLVFAQVVHSWRIQIVGGHWPSLQSRDDIDSKEDFRQVDGTYGGHTCVAYIKNESEMRDAYF